MTPSIFSFMLRWYAPTFVCGLALVCLGLYGAFGLSPEQGSVNTAIQSGASLFMPYVTGASLITGLVMIFGAYIKANALRNGSDIGLLSSLFPARAKDDEVSRVEVPNANKLSDVCFYLSIGLLIAAPAATSFLTDSAYGGGLAFVGCLCGWSFARFIRGALDDAYEPGPSNFVFFLLPPVVFVVGVFNTIGNALTFVLVMGFFVASATVWRKAIG